MSKRVRRPQQQRRRRSRTSRIDRDTRRRVHTELTKVGERTAGRLLDRILSAPHLAMVVPRLQPEVLHRVIQHCGLEDCAPLVTLATPGQLARVFDLDLWRPAAPGRDERFDAGRFGVWLDVMVEAGASSAAATLAAMEVDLVAGGFAQHVRVFDYAAVAPFVTLDGELSPGHALDDSPRCEIGGHVISARRSDCWDAITTVLIALADAHGDYFGDLMRECCRLSNSRPEVDGLDDLLITDEQAMFDLAIDRETRNDVQGYVTPAQARAFLQTSRRIVLRQVAPPLREAMTRAYFRDIDTSVGDDPLRELLPPDHVEPARDVPAEAVAAIVDLLHEAGMMPQ